MIRLVGAVLPLLALAACAAPEPAPGVAAGAAMGSPTIGSAGAGGSAVVVALRPPAPDSPARRRVLAALGVAVASPGDAEVILRADDGRPVSVMRVAGQALRPGERVALLGGPRTRIAPPGPSRAER